ncbi:hypothetical protein [Neptuniibacter sp. CAU 1671]|uniref:hypothetical protein n=1 Tax=Neptuniibacter sp. CAU 1671 TaxID=3032593 RepID=UPI0023DC8886|nr:hypothetical protein [Neptuniibacter sp. CAU 1671]MDF2183137.1 hypothetical protein [Neptuniibacter sp. CAU 1671]
MFLVRDFDGERIVYYWAQKSDSRLERVSPHCPSIPIAQEWFLQHTRQQYQGTERRKRMQDRRLIKNLHKDVDHMTAHDRRQPHGRRRCDRKIHVRLDLAAKKLAEITLNLSLKDH